ncbi:MAG: chromosomal replication initiator protein DnaA [Thermomicrobiales bacterium]
MQARQLWQAVLGDLQARLSKTTFDNWLRQTTLVDFESDVATVAAANTFSASTLQSRYAAEVETVLSAIVGRPVQVRFTVRNAHGHDTGESSPATAPGLEGAPPRAVNEDRAVFGEPVARPERIARRETPTPPTARRVDPARAGHEGRPALQSKQLTLAPTPSHGLNPRYIYDNYVVGSSNRFANAASLSVADHPGGKYNPFYIYGGVGLGKTHLLHAIGHRAIELHGGIVVAYVSSEKFTNDVINAIRAQKMEEFRTRYRSIDILMIDDIQFLGGKDATQEEFFHTFNALYQSGKQVVISSDKPPKAIAGLEERLRSRFEGGLIADVQLPDYEMRTAILRVKGEELGVAIPGDVVEYIAQRDQSNIRELEGALNKILAFAEINGSPLSLQLAMEALTDANAGARRVKATAGSVLDAVAASYRVTLHDLRGRSRSRDIVLPRQVAMYLMREETSASLADIGQELGGRDHTTVMHGIEKIERELKTDTGLRSQMISIREAIFTRATGS